jgi:anti-sigma factor RsiW
MNERANDYVKEWLGAYLDGELSADRRAWVDEHLATCQACQRELVGLRALSTLLHADPAPVPFLEAKAFSRQVVSLLPHPSRPVWRRGLQVGLRYIPLGLFGAWAFFQAAIWVTSLLLNALSLFPEGEGLLAGLGSGWDAGAGAWLGSLFSLSGLNGLTVQINGLIGFGSLTVVSLAGMALMAVLFFAWLAGLWTYQRAQAQETA